MMNRYHILIVCALFVALSGALALFSISSQYRETYRLRNSMEASAVEERLSGVFAAMNDFPGSAGKDMLFLRTLSSVTDLYGLPADLPAEASAQAGALAQAGDFSVEAWRRTHQDIQQFIDRNIAYDEVHLHTPNCMFTTRRVSEDRGDTLCSSHNPTIDDVVTHTLALPQGSVYVSPLIAYTRTVLDKKSTIPAILYGTKVSAPDNLPAARLPNERGQASGTAQVGTGDGAAIAVVNANYFLEEIRRLKRPGENVYLVATDGSYIAHPESEKEAIAGGLSASNAQAGTANFYEDYPSVPAGTLSDEGVRSFNADRSMFTFLRITPTASNFALYDLSAEASAKADGAGIDDARGYWVLVAVSENNTAGHWFFSAPYHAAVLIVGIAHALVIVLLFAVLFPQAYLCQGSCRQVIQPKSL